MILSGSATEAAKFLGITQPAVSRLLGDLEFHLGFSLFERRGSKLLPTADAVTLYREVDRSFIGLERIEKAAKDIRERRGGTLRVAALPALATSFLPKATADFVATRPAVDITLYGMTSPSVLDWVTAGRCDLGIVHERIPHSAITTYDLPAMEAVFIAPSGHPLLERDFVEPKDLHERDIVALASASSMRRRFDAVMITHKCAPKIRMESPLTTIICGLVDAGFGCGIVDPFTASYMPWRNLQARPFRPAITFEWSMIVPNFSPVSSLTEDFVAQLLSSFTHGLENLAMVRHDAIR
ncbi:LysR substrate-binding domain-containing protein [Aureimonas populi]|uniref:LysR substrate-binding domain-containing protein n=1 Tax=Aureimonas populi TaxID=1701758 RepID=UPI001FD763A5|nr:LysR substrate-binding domain-containing protein [Aureimonas populi]